MIADSAEDARARDAGAARRADRRDRAAARRDRHRQGACSRARSTTRASARPGRSSRSTAAALPDALVESELFGRERGAYTGATDAQDRPLRGAPHGGTLFLDEIGELPLEMQVKLLRVLQDRDVRRGSARRSAARSTSASSRRPTATSRQRSRAGTFREDLYYRLDVFPLVVPPLRERREDVAG